MGRNPDMECEGCGQELFLNAEGTEENVSYCEACNTPLCGDCMKFLGFLEDLPEDTPKPILLEALMKVENGKYVQGDPAGMVYCSDCYYNAISSALELMTQEQRVIAVQEMIPKDSGIDDDLLEILFFPEDGNPRMPFPGREAMLKAGRGEWEEPDSIGKKE